MYYNPVFHTKKTISSRDNVRQIQGSTKGIGEMSSTDSAQRKYFEEFAATLATNVATVLSMSDLETDDSWSAPPRMLTGSFHCHLWRQEIGKMINGQPRNGRYSVGQLEGLPLREW